MEGWQDDVVSHAYSNTDMDESFDDEKTDEVNDGFKFRDDILNLDRQFSACKSATIEMKIKAYVSQDNVETPTKKVLTEEHTLSPVAVSIDRFGGFFFYLKITESERVRRKEYEDAMAILYLDQIMDALPSIYGELCLRMNMTGGDISKLNEDNKLAIGQRSRIIDAFNLALNHRLENDEVKRRHMEKKDRSEYYSKTDESGMF